jgi:hypothetical protein
MNRTLFTGIVWNDGSGNFISYMATPFYDHNDVFHGVPDVSASDLDNDGDMDIVFSKVGRQNFNSKSDYKGSAIQFIENLGSKKFREYDPITIVKDSRIGWIKNILFRDLDNDGDIDLYLNSMDQSTNGSVFVNNGDFNFSLIMPPEAYKIYGALMQNGMIDSLSLREEKAQRIVELKKINDEKKKQEKEKAQRIVELKKKQEKEKAERIAKLKKKQEEEKAKGLSRTEKTKKIILNIHQEILRLNSTFCIHNLVKSVTMSSVNSTQAISKTEPRKILISLFLGIVMAKIVIMNGLATKVMP